MKSRRRKSRSRGADDEDFDDEDDDDEEFLGDGDDEFVGRKALGSARGMAGSRASGASSSIGGGGGIATTNMLDDGRRRRSARPRRFMDGDNGHSREEEEAVNGKKKVEEEDEDHFQDKLAKEIEVTKTEEKNSIALELILARRPEKVDYAAWVPLKRFPGDPEDDEGPGPFEYLVKYKQVSYLHIEWVTEHVLGEILGHRMPSRIKKFTETWIRKREDPDNDIFQLLFFDPQFVEIEKIIAYREMNENELPFPYLPNFPKEAAPGPKIAPDLSSFEFLGGKVLGTSDGVGTTPEPQKKIGQYLVKWRGQSYYDCTWETEDMIDDDFKIADFKRMNKPPINLRARVPGKNYGISPGYNRRIAPPIPLPSQMQAPTATTTVTRLDPAATLEKFANHSRQMLVQVGIPLVLRPFIGAGEACGLLRVGDEIVSVNGKRMAGASIVDVAKEIKNPNQSLLLRFYRRSLASSASAAIWKSHELDVHFVTGGFLGLHLGIPQRAVGGSVVPFSVRITGFASPSALRAMLVDSPLRRLVVGVICARGRNWTDLSMACSEIGCTMDDFAAWLGRHYIDDPSAPGTKIPNVSFPDLETKLHKWVKRSVVVFSHAAKTRTTNAVISQTLRRAAAASATSTAPPDASAANTATTTAATTMATTSSTPQSQFAPSPTTSSSVPAPPPSSSSTMASESSTTTSISPIVTQNSQADAKSEDNGVKNENASGVKNENAGAAPPLQQEQLSEQQLEAEHAEHVRLGLILGALWREYDGSSDERFAAEAERQRMLAPEPVYVKVSVPAKGGAPVPTPSITPQPLGMPHVDPLPSAASMADDAEEVNPSMITDSFVDLQYRIIQNLRRKQFQPYQESKPPLFKDDHELRSYQLQGLNWLISQFYAGRNCILADEMGLGKTVQVVAMLDHLRTREGLRGPFLIVAPLSTVGHWQREFENWSNMNVCVYYDGSGQKARSIIREHEWYYQGLNRFDVTKFNVMITTYEIFISDSEFLVGIPWVGLIVDEGHRLRSSKSKLLEHLQRLNGVQHRVLLTGTPLQNNLTELWSLLNFCHPEVFYDLQSFLQRYSSAAVPSTSDPNAAANGGLSLLKQDISPYILRRVKEDVEKSIPPKEETIIDIELTLQQKTFYRAIFDRNRGFLYKGCTTANKPQLCNVEMELRKCCNHPYLIGGVREKEEQQLMQDIQSGQLGFPEPGKSTIQSMFRDELVKRMISSSGKLVLLNKLLPKLRAEGHKVLIFSQMVRMLDLLEEFCRNKGWATERLDGHVRGNLRQSAIDRFTSNDSDAFIFLLSTRAGGVGINLTAADTVIIFDSDWNPQNDAQAQARCHRIGQKMAVRVYRLVTKHTYEETMLDRATQKLGLEQAILGKSAASSAALTKRVAKSAAKAAAAASEKESTTPELPGGGLSGVNLKPMDLEMMLRKGAVQQLIASADDESAARNFMDADIDQLLLRNTRTVKVDSIKGAIILDGSTPTPEAGASSSSSTSPEVPTSSNEAQPVAEGEEMKDQNATMEDNNDDGMGLNIDLHDPDFWKKVLPSAETPDTLLAKVTGKSFSEMAGDEEKRNKYLNSVREMVKEMLAQRAAGEVVDSQDMDTIISVLVQISAMKSIFGVPVAKEADKLIGDLEASRARRARGRGSKHHDHDDANDSDDKPKKRKKAGEVSEAFAAALAASGSSLTGITVAPKQRKKRQNKKKPNSAKKKAKLKEAKEMIIEETVAEIEEKITDDEKVDDEEEAEDESPDESMSE